jgi:uncharacterized membrane protein
MNGVEILSSAQVASEFAFNWTAFWIVTAACFIICLIAYLCTIWECEVLPWTVAMIGIWIFASVMLGGLFGGVVCSTPSEYTTEYKVYLEGDVNMTEFAEKYEILDQEGKIYTVKERE